MLVHTLLTMRIRQYRRNNRAHFYINPFGWHITTQLTFSASSLKVVQKKHFNTIRHSEAFRFLSIQKKTFS